MKRILTLLMIFISSTCLLQAQNVPQAINYQGIATDLNDSPATNTTIGIEISIRETSETGTITYQESHSVMTGPTGIFNLKIGTGNPISGTFNEISWLDNSHYLELGLDLSGGSNFNSYGAVELLSVPYSLVAKEAASIRGFPITGSPTADQFLAWNGSAWMPTDIPAANTIIAGDGIDIATNGNELTVSSTLGTEITANEIASGVIPTDYISTVNAGDGVSVSTTNGVATVSSTLGTTITSDEIVDGQIQAADIAPGVIPITSVAAGTGVNVTTSNGVATVSSTAATLENVEDYYDDGIKVLGTDYNHPLKIISEGTGIWSFAISNTIIAPCTPWCHSILTIKAPNSVSQSVGIKNIDPDPTYELDVNGDIRAGAYMTGSDRRYKKDIISLKDPLSKIKALEGVSYNFDLDRFPDKSFGEEKQFGFIAQEVEKVLPNIVSIDTKGFYSVNYMQVIPLLVESIKQMEEEKESMEERMVRMESMLLDLTAKIDDMERASEATTGSKGLRR